MKRQAWYFDAVVVLCLIAVLGWTASVVLSVETPVIPSMRTVDVFDTTSEQGMRWIVASVEAEGADSALVARYATMLYHRLVPKHLDDTGAVQMEVYVYDPAMRRDLAPDDAALLTRRNPATIDLLGKLDRADSAYIALRLSSPWMILGRDTLLVARSRKVYIPKEGYRWASLVRRRPAQ
ncbi:MAG: hypothetical protein KatS3mg039_0586 [Candidatus Kapaibacterium sp.]|nr:MAG: hypothetical protein KatS3mg039_0586 [Candidatus Kapabacteria bacterium]